MAVCEGVAFGQFGGPGQAQVALHGALACGVLADDLLHGLRVDLYQPTRRHRIEGRRGGIDGVQPLGKWRAIIRQDIQREVVGSVLGQLRLPGVQQLGAQQRNQGHGQQDQAEGQGLAGGGQRVAQQLAEPQAPGQRCPGQHSSQAVQGEQQQAAEHQRGDQATAKQGERQ
ncbi:hypothetical protein D3C71_1594090 [compost metagenome]